MDVDWIIRFFHSRNLYDTFVNCHHLNHIDEFVNHIDFHVICFVSLCNFLQLLNHLVNDLRFYVLSLIDFTDIYILDEQWIKYFVVVIFYDRFRCVNVVVFDLNSVVLIDTYNDVSDKLINHRCR